MEKALSELLKLSDDIHMKTDSVLVFNVERLSQIELNEYVNSFRQVYVTSFDYNVLKKLKIYYRGNKNFSILYIDDILLIDDFNSVLVCSHNGIQQINNVLSRKDNVLFIYDKVGGINFSGFTNVSSNLQYRTLNLISLDDFSTELSVIEIENIVPQKVMFKELKKASPGKIAFGLKQYDGDIIDDIKNRFLLHDIFVFSDKSAVDPEVKFIEADTILSDEKMIEMMKLLSDAEHFKVVESKGEEVLL